MDEIEQWLKHRATACACKHPSTKAIEESLNNLLSLGVISVSYHATGTAEECERIMVEKYNSHCANPKEHER